MSANILPKGVSKNTYIKWGLTILIVAIIALIPLGEKFTLNIKLFLAISIFGILCFAFELLDTTIVALMLPMLYWAFKLAPMEMIFQGWSQSTVWMMFGGMIFGACFDQSGLFKRVTYWFMMKAGGSINALIYGMTTFAIFGIYTGTGAPAILYFVMIYGFCRALDIKPGSDTGALLFYVAYIAGSAVGVMLAYDPMFDMAMNMSKVFLKDLVDISMFNVTYYTYAFHNLIFIPAAFALVWIGTKVFKVNINLGSKSYFQEKYKELGSVTKMEKKAVGSALVMFLLFATQKTTGFDVGLCMMLVSIYCFLPLVGYCGKETLKTVNYSVPFFVAGTMAIGTVANHLGLGQIIAGYIIPFLGSNPFSNAFTIYVIGYIINLVLTPIAGSAIISGPLALSVFQMGINPIPVMYTLVHGLNNVLFPYEGALYLLLFSFGYMTMKQFMKVFTVRAIFMALWIVVAAVPYWLLIGIYNL